MMKENRGKIANIVNRILKCCGIILIAGLCLPALQWPVIFLIEYQRSPHNQKADDAISRAVYKSVGAKEMYYQGKEEDEEGGIHYTYYIHKEEAEPIKEIIKIVNRELAEGNAGDKIGISFEHELFSCGAETVAFLYNYRESGKVSVRYDTLQYLWIDRDPIDSSALLDDPETYRDIPNIRYLELHYHSKGKFEKEASLWHTYWPELETIEISFHGDEIMYFKQFLKEGKSLIEEITEMPEYRQFTRKNEVAFVQGLPDRIETLFVMRNYQEGSELSYPEYDGFQYLWICQTGEGDGGSPYFDLEAYKDIPNIRYLKIDENVQKAADARGIDWYEYWPELETVEVYSPEN